MSMQWPGEKRAPGYRHQAHRFTQLKTKRGALPWQWCRRCGLVLLRTSATEWCREKGCNYDDHPQYRAAMRRLLREDA